jgi:hypothetical protein
MSGTGTSGSTTGSSTPNIQGSMTPPSAQGIGTPGTATTTTPGAK